MRPEKRSHVDGMVMIGRYENDWNENDDITPLVHYPDYPDEIYTGTAIWRANGHDSGDHFIGREYEFIEHAEADQADSEWCIVSTLDPESAPFNAFGFLR